MYFCETKPKVYEQAQTGRSAIDFIIGCCVAAFVIPYVVVKVFAEALLISASKIVKAMCCLGEITLSELTSVRRG